MIGLGWNNGNLFFIGWSKPDIIADHALPSVIMRIGEQGGRMAVSADCRTMLITKDHREVAIFKDHRVMNVRSGTRIMRVTGGNRVMKVKK